MTKYNIQGMSCAACSSRVEKAVKNVSGVTECSVNLLLNSMLVKGSAKEEDIINAVKKAGYGIEKETQEDNEKMQSKNEDIKDTQTKTLIKRFSVSLIFLVILMYVSMGHTMWNFPLPKFLNNNPIGIGLTQLLLSTIIMVINQKFFINGFKGLLHFSPNMDTLVSLGSLASYIYSVSNLYMMTLTSNPQIYLHQFYFESAAMILVLITLGKILESYSKGKTTNALKSLIKLSPQMVTVIKDNKEEIIKIEEIKVNDIFIVKTGESVAVDGVVIEGEASINESAITGESIPVDKKVGDNVSSATINKSGYIKCRATRVGKDTTLSQIIKMVSDASSSKAPIAKVADIVSGYFVPAVIGISVIVFVIWLLIGKDIGFSLSRAISVLVISCPCALGLATPVAIMVGNGIGAKNGILFKNAEALENASKLKIIAVDKTGTITKGEPVVTDIIEIDSTLEELIKSAYSLEKMSEHPLGKAIVKKAEELKIESKKVNEFKVFSGGGVYGKIAEQEVYGGNKEFVGAKVNISKRALTLAEEFSNQGKTPIYFAKDTKLMGIIAVADTVKEDSFESINAIKSMGIEVVMLTGDNERTAKTIANQVGITKIISNVKPEEKERVIKDLQKQGKVAMVGDGINDAPALTRADIGIAIGAGTDIAIESADIVLVNSKLTDLAKSIKLSKSTLKTIYQNLFWAFIYNAICIPVAAGLFVGLGLTLNPMLGAAAMSMSSFCVVTNALRLNFVKLDIKNNKNEKTNNIENEKLENLENKNCENEIVNEKEIKQMEKTIKIEGMMCPHCEARVKKVLEELEGVTEAIVSHKENQAIIKLEKQIENEVLQKVITDNGYTVIEIL